MQPYIILCWSQNAPKHLLIIIIYEKLNDYKYKLIKILILCLFYNNNFHKQIVISAENEYLIEFYKLIDNKVKRLLKLNFESFINDKLNVEIDSIVTEHKTILNAIEQNMPELAEKAMLDHINSSLNNSLLFLKSVAANL